MSALARACGDHSDNVGATVARWWLLERSRAVAGSSCQQQLLSPCHGKCSRACRCSAHWCVTHLDLQPTWGGTSSKGKHISLALAKPHHHQSLSNNNLCCLCSLARLEKSAGRFFFSKNKLTPITVWKSRLHS